MKQTKSTKTVKTNGAKKTVSKNKNCELIFILDRSGSMGGLEEETIKGYNSVVKTQSALDGDLKVTTILFDNQVEKIYDGVDADKAELNNKQYFVRGTTAMLDAIGTTLKEVETRHNKLTKSQRPKKVIVAITTDGYENASKEYTYPLVKKLIEGKQKDGWEFMFLAANIDEKLVGANLGISKDRCTKFESSKKGVEKMSYQMSCMMSKMREN